MASDSSAWAAENGFFAMGSHLDEGKEIFGRVNGIQPVDDETVRVQIGQVKLLLPAGLDLPVGGRLFLARTDDHEYGIWIAPEEEHVPPVQAICPAGFTIDEICREIERGNLIAFLKNRLGDRVDLSLVSFPPIATPDAGTPGNARSLFSLYRHRAFVARRPQTEPKAQRQRSNNSQATDTSQGRQQEGASMILICLRRSLCRALAELPGDRTPERCFCAWLIGEIDALKGIKPGVN